MKRSDPLIVFFLLIIALLVADKVGWRPQPGGGGQATAVPAGAVPLTAVPTQLAPVNTAVPDLVIISPPATWTAVPTPAQAHSLQDVFLIYGEAAAPCINAIQMNQPLTAICQTIRADLIRIAAEQGGK